MWKYADVLRSDVPFPLFIKAMPTQPYYTMSLWHVEDCRNTQVSCTLPPLIKPSATQPYYTMWMWHVYMYAVRHTPPGSGICWPRAVLHHTLGQPHIQSGDIHIHVNGSYNVSISNGPLKLHNISDLYYRGDIKLHKLVEGMCINSHILAECYKTFPTQKSIFQTFQNYWHVELQHMCTCQYDKYNSKKLYSSVYVSGSYHVSVWLVPWNAHDISDH